MIPQPAAKARPRRRFLVSLLLLLLFAGIGGGGWFWWQAHQNRIPEGIVWGNGRVEADDIDITPKYAGRVAELLVDEGDLVKEDQVVARMDTRDVETTLQKSEAQALQAQHALAEAQANVEQRKTDVTLARQQIDRTSKLVADGWATRELLDQRRQALDSATAALNAAQARVREAEHAVSAAEHDVTYYKIMVADGVLVAPRTARVQYRLVNTGEVIGAGAKIFTLLDLSNVYMTVFLPTEEAGKIALGSEGRIAVDALPGLIIPGRVNFVSPTSQFTPKTVETRSERDKLMFRIKVRIEPDVLSRHLTDVRTGLPGVAYVRVNPRVDWPAWLQANVPP